MPRRKVEDTQQPEEPLTLPGSEPQVRLQMTGTAAQVKNQLGVGSGVVEPKPEPVLEEYEAFAKLLKSPKCTVRVKRLRPKMWKGAKANVEVWTSDLPLTWEQIRTEVSENYKGGTYKVSVIAESGSTIDARTFDVEGDPFIEPVEMTAEEKAMFGPQEPDAVQASIDSLGRRALVTQKMIEVEELEHALKEARANRNGGSKPGPNQDDSRINGLEMRLAEAKHQAELEARDRKHAEELRDLKASIAQLQKPAQPAGQSETSMVLAQMQKMQESSDNRFRDMMKQMQDDRMNQLLQKIDNIEKRPAKDGNSLLDSVEVMLKMKRLMNWGTDADDDVEDDPEDKRPWWERALDRLGDKLTPKVIDRLFAKLDGIESGGKGVTKDEFVQNLEVEMKKAEDEAVRIATERAIHALEAPKELAKTPPKTAPQVNVMERKVVGQETPPGETPAPPAAPTPPAAPPADSGAQAPAPAGQVPGTQYTVAQEICLRVCNAIILLERELELRPREFNWNYDGVWSGLPEAILEKVCLAKAPAEVFEAFKVEGIKIEDLDKLKEKVLANPRMAAWMSVGIRELNRWWAAKEKDPEFDPADEEEAPGEEEPQ